MMNDGAKHVSRWGAFLLTVMMLITTCFTPALAEFGAELALNLVWTDGTGQVHTASAVPMEGSDTPAYWATMEAAAMGQTITVEALSSDPAYAFYLLDESGNRTTSFTWEVDAPEADGDYAYWLFYAVNDVQVDAPILLYLSTAPMPEQQPSLPAEAVIPVYYYHVDGTLLDMQEITLP